MATYSTSIKASYFDPRTDIKNRISEFRLDKDSAYMPNLRLSNVGDTPIDGCLLLIRIQIIRVIYVFLVSYLNIQSVIFYRITDYM